MTEIGSTLREARMRAQLDITEVEMSTKIRAKYLRALENEEWGLLPGPTFVRSFLRTYAQELGLDAKLLVEEYRRRHEGYTDIELAPPLRRRPAPAAARRGRPFALTRGGVIALTVAGIVALLLVIGLLSGNEPEQPAPQLGTVTQGRTAGAARGTATHKPRRQATPAAPATRGDRVALALAPTAPVWVCLVDASGKAVVPGLTLEPGSDDASKLHTSKSFTMTLGNGSLSLTVNGKRVDVPASPDPLGYRITPEGRTELAEDERPTCQ